ncbi:MAG: hypothetical protein M1824_004608 [Vezdaea acicularis]|nr:MAG: hypothetical protein M1824_004608 [Vezdaea acicularis]
MPKSELLSSLCVLLYVVSSVANPLDAIATPILSEPPSSTLILAARTIEGWNPFWQSPEPSTTGTGEHWLDALSVEEGSSNLDTEPAEDPMPDDVLDELLSDAEHSSTGGAESSRRRKGRTRGQCIIEDTFDSQLGSLPRIPEAGESRQGNSIDTFANTDDWDPRTYQLSSDSDEDCQAQPLAGEVEPYYGGYPGIGPGTRPNPRVAGLTRFRDAITAGRGDRSSRATRFREEEEGKPLFDGPSSKVGLVRNYDRGPMASGDIICYPELNGGVSWRNDDLFPLGLSHAMYLDLRDVCRKSNVAQPNVGCYCDRTEIMGGRSVPMRCDREKDRSLVAVRQLYNMWHEACQATCWCTPRKKSRLSNLFRGKSNEPNGGGGSGSRDKKGGDGGASGGKEPAKEKKPFFKAIGSRLKMWGGKLSGRTLYVPLNLLTPAAGDTGWGLATLDDDQIVVPLSADELIAFAEKLETRPQDAATDYSSAGSAVLDVSPKELNNVCKSAGSCSSITDSCMENVVNILGTVSLGSWGGIAQSACRCGAQLALGVGAGMAASYTAKCHTSGLLGKRGELGERDLGYACPCNSTYVSRSCCESIDGIVWEDKEMWLGVLTGS